MADKKRKRGTTADQMPTQSKRRKVDKSVIITKVDT
jgi:hypothetical protein